MKIKKYKGLFVISPPEGYKLVSKDLSGKILGKMIPVKKQKVK